MQEENFISISKLISLARETGIDLGKGNPKEYLRYLTKVGLIPHAQRLADPESSKKPPKTVGHYPFYVLTILEKISQLKKIGLSIPEIKAELLKAQQSQPETQVEQQLIKAQKFNLSLVLAFFLVFSLSMLLTTPLPNLIKLQLEQKLTNQIAQTDQNQPQPQEGEKGEVAAVSLEGLDENVFTNLETLGVSDGRFDTTAVNLLRNPSFEANGSGQPRLWTYYNQSTEANTFVTQEGVHTGKNGLKFAGSTNSPYLGIYQPEVKTDWTKPYTLSAWVKVLNAPQITVRLGFWDQPNNQRVHVKEFKLSDTANWQRITASADNRGVYLGRDWFPLIEVYGLTKGSVYLDDVQLEESAGPTLYHALNGALLGDGSISVDASGNLYPTQDAIGDLGISGGRWRKLQLFQASINEEGTLDLSGNASVAGSASFGSINSNLIPNTNNTYDLGSTTNQWNNLYVANLSASTTTQSGNLDMQNNLILNIGAAATDFTTGGGLTLAGDLAVNGGDITSTGALTVTPGAGTNLNIALSTTGDFAVNTNQLYVDTSAARVGVGTGSPQSDLDVSNATGATVTITRDDTTINSGNSIGFIDFWGNDSSLTTQNVFARIGAEAAQTISSDAAAGELVFYTTGTTAGGSPVERMRIDEAGNVGIGDTTPAATLTVGSGDLFQVAGATGNITTAGDLAVNGGDLTTTATTFNLVNATATTVNFAGAATAINLGASSGLTLTSGGNVTLPLLHSKDITITSDLSGGARTADVLTISQANDATNNSTGNLLQLTNSDLGSATAVLDIKQVSGGTSINIGGQLTAGGVGIMFNQGATGGTGIKLDSFTSSAIGIEIDTSSISNYLTSGTGISITGTLSADLSSFTGDMININSNRTHTGAGAIDDTGNYLDIARNVTNSGAGSFAVSGDLVTFSSTCTSCSDTSNILELNQQYANATGAVLNIANSGTGADIAFNTTPTLTIGDTGTLTITDGTNTLLSLVDGGTTGNLTVTGNLTGGSGVTSGTTTLDIGGTGTSWALCHATQTGTDDEGIVDCTGAPAADYAEQYPVASDVEFGDLVVTGSQMVTSTDGNQTVQLVKSSESYQANIIGIVSNNYGDFTSAGYNIKEEDNPMPVALSGRVLTKVSVENGPIEVGDFITSSSTPGVGMKATRAGRVVGMALESYDGPTSPEASRGQDKILVFVNPTFYLGDVAADGSLAEASTTNDQGQMPNDQGLETKNEGLTTNTEATSSAALDISHSTLVDQIIEAFKFLGVTVKDGFLAIKEAVVDKLTVKEIAVDNQEQHPTVGQAKIPAGMVDVIVENSKVGKNSKIFITLTVLTSRTIAVVEKIEGVGFKVAIPAPTTEDITFDYWIVQTTAASKQVTNNKVSPSQGSTLTSISSESTSSEGVVQPPVTSHQSPKKRATQSAELNVATSSAQLFSKTQIPK